MARVAFPLVLQSPSTGSAIVGATATITQHVVGGSLGSGAPATIFTSETGAGVTTTNQITTDNLGRWTQGAGAGYAQYWLPEGTYDIVISGSSLTGFAITRELTSGSHGAGGAALDYSSGLLANRPGVGTVVDGYVYRATDDTNGGPNGTLYQALGGVWQMVQTTSRGAANIATSETRTNTAYGTLPTPDQVTGIVLPTNGLIKVWYQATWQESVAGAARAAIFIGSNQMVVSAGGQLAAPGTQAAATSGSGAANTNRPLVTSPVGLLCGSSNAGYTGNATTGQAVADVSAWGGQQQMELGGSLFFITGGSAPPNLYVYGGSCDVFAAAGTYTVSVQFKASSGSVTASNRRLWVQAKSFS